MPSLKAMACCSLAAILVTQVPSVRADGRTAFASLYSLLGIDERRVDPSLGCEAGRSVGFECLSRLGAWKKVRRYDRPAILELVQPSGGRYQVLLVALGEQSATLMLGGRGRTVPAPPRAPSSARGRSRAA